MNIYGFNLIELTYESVGVVCGETGGRVKVVCHPNKKSSIYKIFPAIKRIYGVYYRLSIGGY